MVEAVEKALRPGGKAIFTSPRLRPREFTVKRDHHVHEFYESEFYYLIEEFFPLVERYSFDRYANAVPFSHDANLMVAVASKWPESAVFAK
jgi:hypothetical protein